jgi:hypothetical protein
LVRNKHVNRKSRFTQNKTRKFSGQDSTRDGKKVTFQSKTCKVIPNSGFYFNVLGPVMGKCEKELEKGRKKRGFKESSKEPSFFAQIHHSRLLFHCAKVHRILHERYSLYKRRRVAGIRGEIRSNRKQRTLFMSARSRQ